MALLAATMVVAVALAGAVTTLVVEQGVGGMVATEQSSSSATDGVVDLWMGRCSTPETQSTS